LQTDPLIFSCCDLGNSASEFFYVFQNVKRTAIQKIIIIITIIIIISSSSSLGKLGFLEDLLADH